MKNEQEEHLMFNQKPETNETGYKTLITDIQNKLNGMDSETQSHYLKETFESYFVYEVQTRDSGNKLYKRNYEVVDGKIEFADEIAEVQMKVDYVAMEEHLPYPIGPEKSEDEKLKHREYEQDPKEQISTSKPPMFDPNEKEVQK